MDRPQATCTQCGITNRREAKWCSQCGNSLVEKVEKKEEGMGRFSAAMSAIGIVFLLFVCLVIFGNLFNATSPRKPRKTYNAEESRLKTQEIIRAMTLCNVCQENPQTTKFRRKSICNDCFMEVTEKLEPQERNFLRSIEKRRQKDKEIDQWLSNPKQ